MGDCVVAIRGTASCKAVHCYYHDRSLRRGSRQPVHFTAAFRADGFGPLEEGGFTFNFKSVAAAEDELRRDPPGTTTLLFLRLSFPSPTARVASSGDVGRRLPLSGPSDRRRAAAPVAAVNSAEGGANAGDWGAPCSRSSEKAEFTVSD